MTINLKVSRLQQIVRRPVCDFCDSAAQYHAAWVDNGQPQAGNVCSFHKEQLELAEQAETKRGDK